MKQYNALCVIHNKPVWRVLDRIVQQGGSFLDTGFQIVPDLVQFL